MLEVRDLSYVYPNGSTALDHVTLSVAAGELVTVIGPNGSGKSTLLKIVSRVLGVSSGTVELEGRRVDAWPAKEYARAVGYLAQDVDAALPIVALDAVASGRAPYLGRFQWESDDDRAKARAALARCDATHLENRFVPEMSGGERKRVMLARVLTGEPRLLVLDEPFASIDLAHVQQLTAVLVEFTRRAGCAALLVSHDVNWAAAASDRIVIMSEGRVAAAGPPREVLTERTIREAFGIDSEIVQRKDGGVFVVPTVALPRRR